MELTLGPIIGTVTHNTARILIETTAAGEVTCELESATETKTTRIYTYAHRPVIFKFDKLQPATHYRVRVGTFQHLLSSFTTFSSWTTLEEKCTFAAVSCNNYRITEEDTNNQNDVWRALADRIEAGDVTMMLHLGDQVYGDDDWSNFEDGKIKYENMIKHCRFAQAMELLKDKHHTEYPAYCEQVTEMYRDAYREAWTHPPAAQALANCPSIMMYDDHDIRDDLGDKRGEFDPESPVYFIVNCGRRVCFEYQRQLHEDFDLSHPTYMGKVAQENHIFHVIGDYGIMMVDSRGAKSFNYETGDPKPFLTTNQWTDIHQSLGAEGVFRDCKLLVFCTQIPIVFFGKALTEKIAAKADDFEGMWSYKNNIHEQTEMLNSLWEWKSAAEGERAVYCVGGDVHLAGHTQIYKDGHHAFDQMICGPVSNKVISRIVMMVTSALKEVGETLNDGWSHEHFAWEANRNVGMIYTEEDAETSLPKITATHLMARGKRVEEVKPTPPSKKKGWWPF
eukprot:NODE_910_length_1772_cov_12.293009_g854_i0.p1 GENE.NODE_910_length_1772_cov_12.293009_g854_i0~~NODE_910_length_1772_cov_12.293009_g854_i0.p1  ORF type:complete len:507 (-),score=146.13 NODE_910_length_1772_cov_12.293009_g854_i0:89-1609(-)